MDKNCLERFKKLGYIYHAPIYDQNGLCDIEFFDDYKRITISKDGALKEIKDDDEYGDSYSYYPLSYEEMKAICDFIEVHKLV